MKKNGFTLVELIATILILTILFLLIFPNFIGKFKSSSTKTDAATIELVEKSAKLYVEDNPNKYKPVLGNMYCITFQELVDEGYLKSPITLSGSDEDLITTKSVQISYQNQFNYKIKDKDDCIGFEIGQAVKLPGKTYVNESDRAKSYYLDYTRWNVLKQTEDTVILLSSDVYPFGCPIYKDHQDYGNLANYNFVDNNTASSEINCGFCSFTSDKLYLIQNYTFQDYETRVPRANDFSNVINISNSYFEYIDSKYSSFLDIDDKWASFGDTTLLTVYDSGIGNANTGLDFHNNITIPVDVLDKQFILFRPVIEVSKKQIIKDMK